MIQQVHGTVNLASNAVRASSLPWMVARTYLVICVSQKSEIQVAASTGMRTSLPALCTI